MLYCGEIYNRRIVAESDVNENAVYVLVAAQKSGPGQQQEREILPLKSFCRKPST